MVGRGFDIPGIVSEVSIYLSLSGHADGSLYPRVYNCCRRIVVLWSASGFSDVDPVNDLCLSVRPRCHSTQPTELEKSAESC